ncbi:MAG: hypothetical protein MI976_26880 [Pseudomonadales bacterium]|nr:hypothetical protein [Pseudomonadales bacterium]
MISLLMQYLDVWVPGRRSWPTFNRVAIGVSLISCLLLGAACTTHNIPETQGDTQSGVLLVNTNSAIDRYAIVQDSFEQGMRDFNITTVDLQNDLRPIETLQDQINGHEYDVIYAIGAKALGSLDYISPNKPIVFSSVLNWRRFKDHSNVYGVASEVAPQAQLTWLKHFFPEVSRVGVIFSTDNVSLINEANKVAGQLDISLVAVKAFNTASVKSQVESLLQDVDILWLISDPKVLSSTESTQALFQLADAHKKPVFAYSEIFADYGAVLSVSADVATTGRQAALIAQHLLSKGRVDREVQFPAGSSITINLDRVKRYGLKLNEEALESVSRIIRDP